MAVARAALLREGRDRLYIVEQDNEDEDDQDADGDITAPVQGRRIVVLSLQGDILQVLHHAAEPGTQFASICCFGRKLLVSYTWSKLNMRRSGMLALQGL